jgi:hypothetical protein
MHWLSRRGISRVFAVLVFLAGTIFAVGLPMAQSALADNCNSEQTIFIYDQSNSVSHGTQGKIYVRNRDLDSNCAENPGAWSMVNFFSSDFVDQGETGYREYAGHAFDDVTCWQAGNTETCSLNKTVTIATDQDYFWKVANDLGTNNLKTYINGGNGWVLTASTTGSPFTRGYSMGETGRYGDTTGMLDHHHYLQSKDSSGNWNDWTGQSKWSKNIDGSDWYYYKISNTNYEICENGGACPWQ